MYGLSIAIAASLSRDLDADRREELDLGHIVMHHMTSKILTQ